MKLAGHNHCACDGYFYRNRGGKRPDKTKQHVKRWNEGPDMKHAEISRELKTVSLPWQRVATFC